MAIDTRLACCLVIQLSAVIEPDNDTYFNQDQVTYTAFPKSHIMWLDYRRIPDVSVWVKSLSRSSEPAGDTFFYLWQT